MFVSVLFFLCLFGPPLVFPSEEVTDEATDKVTDEIFDIFFENGTNWNTTVERPRRAPRKIQSFIDPNKVLPVESILQIDSLTSRNLPEYIGHLNDKSRENMKKAFSFLAQYDVIANERNCEKCYGKMSLTSDSSAVHDKLMWRCPDCRNSKMSKKVSIRKNSFFSNFKLTVHQVLYLASEWIENPQKPVVAVAQSFGINKNTVSELHEVFRDLTQQWFYREVRENDHAKLGGKGKVVEIDETAMFKPKYNKGRLLTRPTIWVFGLIERGTHKIAMFQVPSRDRATLFRIIQEHVLPETTIISDGWAAYGGLGTLRQQYKHHSVNHKLNFVSPTDKNVHTQSIEASWGALKRGLKSRYGDRDYLLQGHLFTYIFRRRLQEKLLNRLIIEMRYYDSDEEDLFPRGSFEEPEEHGEPEEHQPAEATEENDNNEPEEHGEPEEHQPAEATEENDNNEPERSSPLCRNSNDETDRSSSQSLRSPNRNVQINNGHPTDSENGDEESSDLEDESSSSDDGDDDDLYHPPGRIASRQRSSSDDGNDSRNQPSSSSAKKSSKATGKSEFVGVATKRREGRGKGRQEGYQFRADLEKRQEEKRQQQQQSQSTAGRGHGPTRGRGSRGGKIANRLYRTQDKQEDKQKAKQKTKHEDKQDKQVSEPAITSPPKKKSATAKKPKTGDASNLRSRPQTRSHSKKNG